MGRRGANLVSKQLHVIASQAAGDAVRSPSSFELEVVRPNEERLGRLATVVLGDPVWAEDVVADVFMAIWPKWRDRRVENVEAYLRRAVIRRAARYRRRHILLAPHSLPEKPTAHEEPAIVSRQLCIRALMTLNENERALVALKFISDMTDPEIASTLGIPLGTVKSRIHRALGKLKSALTAGDEKYGR